MDSTLERMRGKQSKCLAIRPPGGAHIFQCVPLTGLGARMAACWRPGELPSGGAAVEVLSTTAVFQTGTCWISVSVCGRWRAAARYGGPWQGSLPGLAVWGTLHLDGGRTVLEAFRNLSDERPGEQEVEDDDTGRHCHSV